MGAFAKRRAQEAAAAQAAQRARAPVETKDYDDDEGTYKPPRWMYPLVVVADVVRSIGNKVRKCVDARADDANALFQVEQAILVAARPAPIVQLGANAAVAERLRQDEASRALDGSIGLGAGALYRSAASKVRAFQTNEPGSGSVRAGDSRSRRNSEASVHTGKASRAGTSDSAGMIDPLSPHTPTTTGRWGLAHKGSNGSLAGEGAQASEKSSKKKGSKVAPSPTLDSPPLSGVRATPGTPHRVPSGLPPLTPRTPVTTPGSMAKKTTSAETIPRNSSHESFALSPGSDSKRPVNRRLSASGGGRSGGRPVPAGMLGAGTSFSTDASTLASSSNSFAFERDASYGGGRSLVHGSHSGGGLVRVPEVQVERTPVSTAAGKGRRVAW